MPEEIRTPDPQIVESCSRIAGHRLGRKVAIPRDGIKIWREAAVRGSLEMPRVYCRDAELLSVTEPQGVSILATRKPIKLRRLFLA